MSETSTELTLNAIIKVPQGGSTINKIRLTPTEVVDKAWCMEVLKQSGEWVEANDYSVLFNHESTRKQAKEEMATIVVTMSDEAVKKGWVFVNKIKIYHEKTDFRVKINSSITKNNLTWVFNIKDEYNDESYEVVDYGYIASFEGKEYIQPDPAIIIGRPAGQA